MVVKNKGVGGGGGGLNNVSSSEKGGLIRGFTVLMNILVSFSLSSNVSLLNSFIGFKLE